MAQDARLFFRAERLSGDDDDRDRGEGCQRLEALHHQVAIAAREAEVEDDDVRPLPLGEHDGRSAIAGGEGLEACGLQLCGQQSDQLTIAVDQKGLRPCHKGSPPCASAHRRCPEPSGPQCCVAVTQAHYQRRRGDCQSCPVWGSLRRLRVPWPEIRSETTCSISSAAWAT